MEKSRQCGVYGKCQKCEKYEYDQNPINISFDVIRYGAFGVFCGFPESDVSFEECYESSKIRLSYKMIIL